MQAQHSPSAISLRSLIILSASLANKKSRRNILSASDCAEALIVAPSNDLRARLGKDF